MKILLITGWGLGTTVLDCFADQLRLHHELELWDIFDPTIETVLSEKIERACEFDVLMGWSLGGQLALLLADEIANRTKQAKPVIACMSNPCFVQNGDWSAAMPPEHFKQFTSSAQRDMATTVRRFCSLVTLGSEAPRKRAKQLQQHVLGVDLDYQQKLLYLLEKLDLLSLLKVYQGKTLFIFADQDSLVPYSIAQQPELISISNVTVEKINGAHDAILFDANRVLEPVQHFLASIHSSE